MRSAGVVLAGGRSSRMGTPKAALEWHGSTLLRRTVGVLTRVVDGPVLVVRAPDQELPPLPPAVEVVEDPAEGLGPLQGIAAGLGALDGRAEVAFVSSTDMPFLHPAFVRRVLAAVAPGVEVALPHARGYPQPLAAAYRVSLAPLVAELVAAGGLRPAFLFRRCATVRPDDSALLTDVALAAADPELDSVLNVNEPDDYAGARARPAPEVTVHRDGTLAGSGHRGPRSVRAATLVAAADAAGLELDRQVVAVLNGEQLGRDGVPCDGELPLVAGDTVAFRSADAAPRPLRSELREPARRAGIADMATENPLQNVTFPSNGSTAHGYLTLPESGSGPGLVVIQEWWGLTSHVADVTNRFAAEGFVALAPDLFGGTTTHDADEAGKLMHELPVDQAATDLVGAVDYLLGHEAVTSSKVGAVGFCMGGGFVLVLAAQQGDKIGAAVSFYGVLGEDYPSFSGLTAPLLGHFGQQDEMNPPEKVRELAAAIEQQSGQRPDIRQYPAGHAFFNDENLLGTYDPEQAAKAWDATLGFLRQHLR